MTGDTPAEFRMVQNVMPGCRTAQSTDESGNVVTGGHKVLVTCSVSVPTAKMLKVCKDCLGSLEKGCHPMCKNYKGATVRKPRPPATKFQVRQAQHQAVFEARATQPCTDWAAGRPCKRGGPGICVKTHRPEDRGVCHFFAKRGNCSNVGCPYMHEPEAGGSS